MPSFKLPKLFSLLRPDDFRITTWLAVGACIHFVATLCLPHWIAIQIPLLLLLSRSIQMYLAVQGIRTMPSSILSGRWTARIPADKSASTLDKRQSPVVMFILAARTTHPLGRLAPGLPETGRVFAAMWTDAEENREKWGFLGKSVTLYGDTGDCGTTMVWLSYWKDLDGLRAFAAGDTHRVGWNKYLAKQLPNLGIMHETYYAPNGNWESIYHEFHPFGLGQTKFIGEDGLHDHVERLRSPLSEAKDPQLKSMFSRMGRE